MTRVYAVGDVHGRADLLDAIHTKIVADAKGVPTDDVTVVYLGDYIDRGPDSRRVVETLMADELPFNTVHLRGNHEAMALAAQRGEDYPDHWLANGGRTTLESYGGEIPAGHLDWMQRLPCAFGLGAYWFVHAGIRPGVPLERQVPEDVMWIRGQFLASDTYHGRIIIHGHTPTDEPDVQFNRIGIDTGAYWTGRLTALVLDGGEPRFLQTGEPYR